MFLHGDILFSQLGSNENAISAVTRGYRDARINHMGVVLTNLKGLFVLEAFPPEVRVTQLEVFLRRSADPVTGAHRYILARLTSPHRSMIPAAISYGLERRNVPYDDLYMTDEGALYCSELVVDMFRYANGGLDFFVEEPMSFRDPATGEILPAWIEYYARFGLDVPESAPGSNPGAISRDERIDVVHVQGPPAGYSP